MSAVRAVLFDMDGVLVDVSGSYRLVIAETAEHFTHRSVPPEAIQQLKNAGGFNDDWKVTAALIGQQGVDVPFERVVTEFNRRYRGDGWDGYIAHEPFLLPPGMMQQVRTAVGSAGVVTGRPRAEAEFTLERFGWSSQLDVFVPMEDQNGRGKPDPYPLLLAIERLVSAGKLDEPGEAVYVGDSVDDMRAARAAGCGAIGFVPPYLDAGPHSRRLLAAGAEDVLTNHDGLLEIVCPPE